MGDAIICRATELICDCFSAIGTCYRIGGDEFAVILRGTDETTVKEALKSLEQGIRKYNIDCEPELSISYGYAFRESTAVNLEDLFNAADSVMYIAKQNKRKTRDFAAKPINS